MGAGCQDTADGRTLFLADDLDERARVTAALDAHDGKVTQAARALGVGRTTLYKLLHLHGIRPLVDQR